jgi:hypothetical protein
MQTLNNSPDASVAPGVALGNLQVNATNYQHSPGRNRWIPAALPGPVIMWTASVKSEARLYPAGPEAYLK